MHEIPVLNQSTDTVADMTLRLDIVREIPALTGDMRPQWTPAAADTQLDGFEFAAADMVAVPAFGEALGSQA